MLVNLNLDYAIRVLARERFDENVKLMATLFHERANAFIRRDIILIMAGYKADYWIADQRNNFRSFGPWERRAVIVASYLLGDEGKHWRNHVKSEFTPIEQLFRDWASKRFANQNWSVPL